jgi:hypothetical protein
MSSSKRLIIDLTLIESPNAKRIALEEAKLAPTQEKESNQEEKQTENGPPYLITKNSSENEDIEYRVDLPEDFTPEKHPQIFLEIIDEAVMLYKDVKDKQAWRWLRAELLWGKAPQNAMKNILIAIETKYNLPPGAIKEYAVRKRLKSYLMKDKPSVSLINDVEQRLLLNTIRMAKKHPDTDLENALDHFEIYIPAAKDILKHCYAHMDPALRGQYSLVHDHVQLDIYWATNFKSWALEVLNKPGILDDFEFDY